MWYAHWFDSNLNPQFMEWCEYVQTWVYVFFKTEIENVISVFEAVSHTIYIDIHD